MLMKPHCLHFSVKPLQLPLSISSQTECNAECNTLCSVGLQTHTNILFKMCNKVSVRILEMCLTGELKSKSNVLI